MMKKFLSIFIVSLLVLSTATTAFAAGLQTETTTSGWSISSMQIQEKIEQKKQEVIDFKKAAQGKSALAKAAAEENKALLQITNAKRKELAQVYTDLKEDGATFDLATLEQIAKYRQQVRNLIDELRDSKGSIREYIKTNKEALKSLDYSILEIMYADIAEIQSWRSDQLNEINQILDEMLALVQ